MSDDEMLIVVSTALLDLGRIIYPEQREYSQRVEHFLSVAYEALIELQATIRVNGASYRDA